MAARDDGAQAPDVTDRSPEPQDREGMPDDVQTCDRAPHGSSEMQLQCQEQTHLSAWLLRVSYPHLRRAWRGVSKRRSIRPSLLQSNSRMESMTRCGEYLSWFCIPVVPDTSRTRFRNETARFSSEKPRWVQPGPFKLQVLDIARRSHDSDGWHPPCSGNGLKRNAVTEGTPPHLSRPVRCASLFGEGLSAAGRFFARTPWTCWSRALPNSDDRNRHLSTDRRTGTIPS